MHVGIVGGLDRNSGRYEDFAREMGHSIECHTGHLEGTGSQSLDTLILRSDLVIVVTDVNSHAAVWRAKKLARLHRRPCVLVRRMGASRLRRLLQAGSSGKLALSESA